MRQAINLNRMKRSNQLMLLNEIRKGTVSRAELAERLQLTRASITQNVDELIQEGLVRESGTTGKGVGRRAILLSLRAEARYIGGINIRRCNIEVGWVNLAGEILSSGEMETAGATAGTRLQAACGMLHAQCSALNLPKEKILGAGVCAPGPLDGQCCQLLNPPNFEHWHGVKIDDYIDMPMVLENNADALALEEKYFGLAQNAKNVMVVQVDEGVGAGLLIDANLYRGSRGVGGEFGHMSIEWNGRKCACGNIGCLEAYASIPAILAEGPYDCWEDLVDGVAANLPDARRLLELEAQYLSSGLVSAMNLMDLERVIVHGDVRYRAQYLSTLIERLVAPRLIAARHGDAHKVLFSNTLSSVRTGATALLNAYFQGEFEQGKVVD